MSEFIEIRGARENNLKDVSLRIPKRKITIFTGVSGSGKSSIVFDTIAVEAQRQLYENFSFFIRSFLPRYPQPDADAVENLSLAVVVDQKRLGGGSHSTVGTVTDIYTLLRLLYSRVGTPPVGTSIAYSVEMGALSRSGRFERIRDTSAFSFNDPRGMCPECHGSGEKVAVDSSDFLDHSKSLNEGAVRVPVFAEWERGIYAASGFFDNDKKLSDYSPDEMDLLLHGKGRKFKMPIGGGTMNATYLGVIERFERAYVRRDVKTLSERTRKAVAPYLKPRLCPLCRGARLSQAALACRINGRNIADLSALEIDELIPALEVITDPAAAPIVEALIGRLRHVVDIGLEYLSLDRETDTLSGGESQRVKMVKHLGGGLVDAMYVFDEPSVGLHPRDVHRLNEHLRKLRDKGNTVLVVEHDPDVIQAADHVVDVGPGAGVAGGRIVFEGGYAELLAAETLTGRHIRKVLPLKEKTRTATGWIPVRNARANNLKDISLDIPTGVLVAITGVAGSGKSSLIDEVFLPEHPEAVVVDQSAVGTSTRSNPATYTGVMDHIRKAFAAANEVDAGLFSFNSKGACGTCKGSGSITTELGFLDPFETPCEACRGRRFKDEVLAYTLNGKSISDVLALTVSEALAFFTRKEITRRLRAVGDVGLDYLTLGQPLSTLSGGECQRVKLACELHKDGSIYVLDEPTTGLHMSDISRLLSILDRIVDGGNTVIVIEHNMNVIRNADWIIDLGPEGGNKGGEVIFAGPPKELRTAARSLTGRYI